MPQDITEVLPEWIKDPNLLAIPANLLIPLPSYGIIEITGIDAKKFLQGQLTCNLDNLDQHISQWGSYCDHKGRVLSVFWILYTGNSYQMILPLDILTATLVELQKFAIFSKVTLTDISEKYHHIGLCSHNHSWQKNFRNRSFHGITSQCWHIIEPKGKHQLNSWKQQVNPQILEENFWDWLYIRKGIPMIHTTTRGLFTPHSINLVHLGAVSFNKGCYRGQEIVARMEYLGKLKQHLYHCHLKSTEPPMPGDSLKTEDQNLGHIENIFALTEDTYEITAVLNATLIEKEQQFKLTNGTLDILKSFTTGSNS